MRCRLFRPAAQADPEGSPDGDGQYAHYNTKWMFALNRLAIVTGEARFNEWAIELATSASTEYAKLHAVWTFPVLSFRRPRNA